MTDQTKKLLAAAGQLSGGVCDVIDAAEDGEIRPFGNVAAGDTAVIVADGLRLLIDATHDTPGHDADTNQLQGALIRFLETRP